MLQDAVASPKFFMTTFRKKIIMGTSASAGRSDSMSRSTAGDTYTPTAPPAPPSPQNCTVTIEVAPDSPRCMFYRDEIFDVEILVKTISEQYNGTMKLELLADTKEQTLGNRSDVQMYDFGRDDPTRGFTTGITQLSFSESDFIGIEKVQSTVRRVYQKRFKAVINVAQTVKIKATHVKTTQQNYDLSNETGDIHIVHRLRQYTTDNSNDTVNNYDDKIIDQLNYWDDWNIPESSGQTSQTRPYTFMTDARPSAELVKALAYKASSLNPDTSANSNLMGMTTNALNRMTTGHTDVERDVNASALDDQVKGDKTYSGGGDAAPLMDYGTRNQGGTVEDAPAVTTIDDSFRWGIRWLIAKRTQQEHRSIPAEDGKPAREEVSQVRRINWWVPDSAVRAYADSNGQSGDVNYVTDVRRLYAEGRDPNSGTSPTYLWPIKSDESARQ